MPAAWSCESQAPIAESIWVLMQCRGSAMYRTCIVQTAILQHAPFSSMPRPSRVRKVHPRALRPALGLLGLTPRRTATHERPSLDTPRFCTRSWDHGRSSTTLQGQGQPSPASRSRDINPISHRFDACRQHIHTAMPKAASVRGGKHGQASQLDIIVEYEPSIGQQGTPRVPRVLAERFAWMNGNLFLINQVVNVVPR